MTRVRAVAIGWILGAGVTCLCGCSHDPDAAPARAGSSTTEQPPVTEAWDAMGTFASLSVPRQDRQHLQRLAATVKEIFRELDETLSLYKPDSELSQLRGAAGRNAVPISDRTREILEIASRYVELSGGAFEPTLGPLVRLWGFNDGALPETPLDRETVASALRRVGYHRLVLTERTAYLEAPGMAVDLGGIAKGYAVDVAYARLLDMKAENGMINLGGNIRCWGLARGRKPWKVGVQDPFDRERLVGTIELTDGMAVASSGNYERFVTIDGKRYAHIIDPRSGYPVEGMAGVTVISRSAVEADAMSTALFVLGPREARPVLDRLPGCHALFIPDRRPTTILVTPGFKEFRPLEEYADAVRPVTSTD